MQSLVTEFERKIVAWPRLTLAVLILACASLATYVLDFRLDASSDSLLLEADPDLRYYRGIRAEYGSDDYLIVTFSADRDLFDPGAIAILTALRDELRSVPGIDGVTTMLDVPLIASPPATLEELQVAVPNLLSPETDLVLARAELTDSPLYRELIMSRNGRTTAILINLARDPEYDALVDARDQIWIKRVDADLTAAEERELIQLNASIASVRERLVEAHRRTIAAVRDIMDRYRDRATLRLGGLPMIVTDMLEYVLSDVIVFGAGILLFLTALLSVIFVRPRWVLLSLATCSLSALVVAGFLGMAGWPVTVVSANFVALLLIFSLSLTVHLIVRYQELHLQHPDADQSWLVLQTARDKFEPCLFTAATTMVAFASLLVSGIRPVIDFGWMMVIGMAVVLLMAFTLFPAGLTLLSPGTPQEVRQSTDAITSWLARLIERFPLPVLCLYVAMAVVSAFGITRLSVENRFIDNFKDSTEIYQGLATIDRELGGTMPLDVILEADPDFLVSAGTDAPVGGESPDDEPGDSFDDEFADESFDEFADEFADVDVDEFADSANDLGATSYWYNTFRLEQVAAVHDYLESLPETGKVLSMDTTIDTLTIVNGGEKPGTFFLSLVYKNLPPVIKETLFDPYMSADGNQLRFSIRVYESIEDLRRGDLLVRIRSHLIDEMGFKPEQVRLTGMMVLYNNVLQSLYRSQILTIGFVFLAILAMFVFLFGSLRVAFVALTPNVLAALVVLGTMGLFGIPLDIMTITIAAITIGIGVDDSIHYVHRFREEFEQTGNYVTAVRQSHATIGRAMYYTSVIIATGFSILVLSNFLPTIFFGLFTSFAMLFAMIANLTLLPLLLIGVKPFGPEAR